MAAREQHLTIINHGRSNESVSEGHQRTQLGIDDGDNVYGKRHVEDGKYDSNSAISSVSDQKNTSDDTLHGDGIFNTSSLKESDPGAETYVDIDFLQAHEKLQQYVDDTIGMWNWQRDVRYPSIIHNGIYDSTEEFDDSQGGTSFLSNVTVEDSPYCLCPQGHSGRFCEKENDGRNFHRNKFTGNLTPLLQFILFLKNLQGRMDCPSSHCVGVHKIHKLIRSFYQFAYLCDGNLQCPLSVFFLPQNLVQTARIG